MTVTLDLKPEIEQGLRAQAHARGVSLDEFLKDVVIQAAAAPQFRQQPIWDVIADSMQDVPPEDMTALPSDGASQIDHYVYGLPKR